MDEDARILEEAHPLNLWAIMASIQALALMVALLQLVSRRQRTGWQRCRK